MKAFRPLLLLLLPLLAGACEKDDSSHTEI